IGCALCGQRDANGDEVRALVGPPGRLASFDSPRLEIFRGDLSNPADLNKALDGIKYVYHLARAHVKTWEEYELHEIKMTERVAEACLANGVEKLIYTGTIASHYN